MIPGAGYEPSELASEIFYPGTIDPAWATGDAHDWPGQFGCPCDEERCEGCGQRCTCECVCDA